MSKALSSALENIHTKMKYQPCSLFLRLLLNTKVRLKYPTKQAAHGTTLGESGFALQCRSCAFVQHIMAVQQCVHNKTVYQ